MHWRTAGCHTQFCLLVSYTFLLVSFSRLWFGVFTVFNCGYLVGIRWYDRVRNDEVEVLQRTGLTSLSQFLSCRHQTWIWVIGSSFWPGVRPEFFWFSKKMSKMQNAEMTKVIVRCLLLDWNHWMSVHAMNFYFYPWLLKIIWPENTSSHISWHL